MDYYDTSKDVRILYLEALIEKSLRVFVSRKIPFVKHSEFMALLKDIRDIIQKIKWSYVPIRDLQDLLELLNKKVSQLEALVLPYIDKADESTRKFLIFVLRNLKSFSSRLKEIPDITNVVPVRIVKVISVEKHPKARNLMITWVSDGNEKYLVVTNDKTIRRGDVVSMAILPPREFMGVISEGMFIGGDNGIRRLSEDYVGKSVELTESEKRKLQAEIANAIKLLKS